MLAEASGCGAVLDVAAVPTPGRRRHGRLAHLLPRLRDDHRRRARPAASRRPAPADLGRVRRARRPAPASSCAGPTARPPRASGGVTGLGPAAPGATAMTDRRRGVAANFGRDLDDASPGSRPCSTEPGRAGRSCSCCPRPRSAATWRTSTAPATSSLPPALDVDGPGGAPARRAGRRPRRHRRAVRGRRRRAATTPRWPSTGDGVLGVHRKVHQPLGEGPSYAAGDRFAAFDTPVGRLGMMICYDKAFPEAARALALDGAEIVCCMSAWPAGPHATPRPTSPTTAGRGASTCSTAPAPWRTRWCGCRPTSPARSASLRFVGQRQGRRRRAATCWPPPATAGGRGVRHVDLDALLGGARRRHVPPARPAARRLRRWRCGA